MKRDSIAKNNYNFADLIGNDDITLIDQHMSDDRNEKIQRLFN